MQQIPKATAEALRIKEDQEREKNWKRWGPYLSDRQWGTVREDYSPDGSCWNYFPHDHARSRAYRWGEDGLLGITDRECRLCFSIALWNGKDSILKERLFGLTGPEGNHGEDVKECYFYLESAPTHSYMRGLYKYPQAEFPYAKLVEENKRRKRTEMEFELIDTGLFNENRYFDVMVEYAKGGPNDILIRITISNRGSDPAPIHLLPTLWFRNTWSWGRSGEGYSPRGRIRRRNQTILLTESQNLEPFFFAAESTDDAANPLVLLTENETNISRLFGSSMASPFVKDLFHDHVIKKNFDAIHGNAEGSKAAFHYQFTLQPGQSVQRQFRLYAEKEAPIKVFGESFAAIFDQRKSELQAYYNEIIDPSVSEEERKVIVQAYAGLLWSKQFYHYSIREWLEGDPTQPAPAETRKNVRNFDWAHLYNRDIISMPDKWEYPWYAAWDLAFHMIPFAKVDPEFTKQQLILFLREWYMHPNGQLPAYEFAFGDVNPPVHAWACWRVYKLTGKKGSRDRVFLARVFQKLLLNFTWWVNRKDIKGNNLFAGGFLGLDNIGVFDRSRPVPVGEHLEQADGTAWMAFFCAEMLSIATELASYDPAYEDVASKFFEHFIAITDAMNNFGGTGMWDDIDGFYYDQLYIDGKATPLRIRSIVGIIPLLAVEVLENDVIERLPGFRKRMKWFLTKRQDLARNISYMEHLGLDADGHRLLAVPSRARLTRMLRYVLDENEFLSPYGVRSLSRVHKDHPYVLQAGHESYRVSYDPAESNTEMFGGNSNWRGPVWFPVNYLLIEALERYHYYYGNSFVIECPTGSGRFMNLGQVAQDLSNRLSGLFLTGESGARPSHGGDARYKDDPHWKELLLFYEYFHGDSGRGCGASHQTGWTALVTRCIEKRARARSEAEDTARTLSNY